MLLVTTLPRMGRIAGMFQHLFSSSRSEEDVMPNVLCMVDEKHQQICIISHLLSCWRECRLYNEEVGISSCLVDLALCLLLPLRHQETWCPLCCYREDIMFLGFKCHAESRVHRVATWSPHMSTVLGAWCVSVPIKHNNCSAILSNDICTVLLRDLVIHSSYDTIR